jgi:hypothetical protein
MIPDSYRLRSPDAFDINGEQNSTIAANRISIKADANAMALVALIFSVGALVALYMQSSAQERLAEKDRQVIEAKIKAGAAAAESTAHAADVNARVAVDEIERMRTALAAQKIVIPKSHD